MKKLTEEEWKALQELVKKKDSEQADLIGVNISSVEITLHLKKRIPKKCTPEFSSPTDC